MAEEGKQGLVIIHYLTILKQQMIITLISQRLILKGVIGYDRSIQFGGKSRDP